MKHTQKKCVCLRRVVALLLVLLLVGSAFSPTVFALEPEYRASSAGTVISDEFFDSTVVVGGIDSEEEPTPVLCFSGCRFSGGLTVLGGGNWILRLENSSVLGSIDVIQEGNPDAREDHSFLRIEGLPSETTVISESTALGIQCDEPGGTCVLNGVTVTAYPEEGMYLESYYEHYDEENGARVLSINGAETASVEGDFYDKYCLSLRNEKNSELQFDSTQEGFLILEGRRFEDFGCSCEGGACDCECCSRNGCNGEDCSQRCVQDGYCEACRNPVPDNFVPGTLKVTGTLSNKQLLLVGALDIHTLVTGADATLEIASDYDQDNILNIGSKTVQMVGEAWCHTEITAAAGAVVETFGGCNVTVNELNIGGAYIYGDGNVSVPVTDSAVAYEVNGGNGTVAMGKTIQAATTELIPEVADRNAVYYMLSAVKDGVTIREAVFHASVLVATEEGTDYQNRTFEEPVRIVSFGADGGEARIYIDNCVFEQGLSVNSEDLAAGVRTGISFGDHVTLPTLSLNGSTAAFFQDPQLNLWNLPDGTNVTSEALPVDIDGERPNSTLTINGTVVSIGAGDGERARYHLDLRGNCMAPHESDYNDYDHSQCNGATATQLGMSGDIATVQATETAIDAFNFSNLYTDVSLSVSRTENPARLSVRNVFEQHENDDSPRAYRENALVTVTGRIVNAPFEVVGRADISGFDTENTCAEIGSWEASVVNIGDKRVMIIGGAEREVQLIATTGAFVELQNERIQVSVNDGAFAAGVPHIFGNENQYAVYVGTADREIEYHLYCDDVETACEAAYIDSENKTHLTPDPMNNSIGNWRLEAVKDGITIVFPLRHMQEMCEHAEFSAWTVTEAATCTTEGRAERTCTDCGFVETTTLLPTHEWETAFTVDTPPTCTAPGSGSVHCKHCDAVLFRQEIPATGHKAKVVAAVPATMTADGKTASVCCAECGIELMAPETIARVSRVSLAATTYYYDGSVKTPALIVSDATGQALRPKIDYTYAYAAGRKAIGTYAVTVTFRGRYSGTKVLTFKILPVQVTGLKAGNATSSSVSLSWKKVPGAVGYEVYNAATKQITRTTRTTAVIKGFKPGAAAYLYVRAYAKSGTTVFYGLYSTRLAVAALPAAPKLKLVAGRGAFAASWSASSGASGYQLTYTGATKAVTTTSMKYTVTGLKRGRTYAVYVRSYKKIGSQILYSGWSAAQKVKVR